MKYIKKYKLFESIDSDDYARATIGDMALDLKDDGFNVSISPYSIHKDPTGTHGKIFMKFVTLSLEWITTYLIIISFLISYHTYMMARGQEKGKEGHIA